MELKRYTLSVRWNGEIPVGEMIEQPDGEFVLYADMVKRLHEHFFPDRGFEE